MSRLPRNFVQRAILPLLALFAAAFAVEQVLVQPGTLHAVPVLPTPDAPYGASVAGVGIIEPRSEVVELGANLPGVVIRQKAEPGLGFKKGDPLFTIDDRDQLAQVKLAETELAVAQVNAADARDQLALFEAVKDRRAISTDDLHRRRFALQLAEARVEEAKAKIETLKTTLERLTVTAPFDGVVLRRNVKVGEYAPAGATGKPLLVVGDTSRLHVRVEVDEAQAWRVTQQAKATGSLRGNPKMKAELTFVRFEPQIVAKRNVTGAASERVDTRVLEVVYGFDPASLPSAFVGQQMDVFIQADPMPWQRDINVDPAK